MSSLLCRVGSRVCALPIRDVLETMRPLPIAALAGAPAFVLGLSVVRGVPIPVIDAQCLFGSTGEPWLSPTRFVTIRTGGRLAALAVDGVLGVQVIEPWSLADLPPLLGEIPAETVAAIGALDTDLLMVLRSAQIVPETVWAAIDAERPPS